MLLVHIGIASMRQFQCAPTTYVNAINECFFAIKQVFNKLLNYFLWHVERNKFLCSLACTWMTIIDSQFYIIDRSSLDVSLE